jgi:hypothetical protein
MREYDYDFFIAHAGADTVEAERLFDLLSGEAKVFLDSRCLIPGDDWPTVVQKAQRNSSATLVLISDRTDQAFYQGEEIAAGIALSREGDGPHRVIPLYCPGGLPQDVPYGLRRKHALQIDGNTSMEQVATRLLGLRRALALEWHREP